MRFQVALYSKPAPYAHHPHVGCTDSPICYPSIAFLESLIKGADEYSNVVVEFGPFLGESTVGIAQVLHKMG